MIDIPISKIWIDSEVHDRIKTVLDSGMIAQGPQVAELEKMFCEVAGAEHAIAVNNGTTALVLALEVLDLKPGDEVITSPFTFAATLNAIIESGATARFVDIDDDFLMDVDLAKFSISDKTKVLLPVHLYGQMVDMEGLEAVLSSRKDVTILEDAAQSVGARFNDHPAGSYGLGCFSLYATKNVGAGEGGVVTTNDSLLAERMRILRNQGMKARYEYVVPGHNYRLTDLQAAVANPQLKRISEITEKRNQNARKLLEGLSGLEGLGLPKSRPNDTHVWNQFTIRITSSAPTTREHLIQHLEKLGISSGIYYPKVVFDYDCYRNNPQVVIEHVPKAEKAAREVLSLPVHPFLTGEQINRIIDGVRSAWS